VLFLVLFATVVMLMAGSTGLGVLISKGHGRLVALVVHLRVFLLLINDHLHDEVGIGRLGKLLEAHVNVRIHGLEVLVLFPGEETVILALILNPVLGLLAQLLIHGALLDLILQRHSLCVSARGQRPRHALLAAAAPRPTPAKIRSA